MNVTHRHLLLLLIEQRERWDFLARSTDDHDVKIDAHTRASTLTWVIDLIDGMAP